MGGGKYVATAKTTIEMREIESEPMGTESNALQDLRRKLRKEIDIEVRRRAERQKFDAWNKGEPIR